MATPMKFIPVSKRRPCELCGGTHKCSTTDDGLILCGRKEGPQPGFKHVGTTKDGTWQMYRDLVTLACDDWRAEEEARERKEKNKRPRPEPRAEQRAESVSAGHSNRQRAESVSDGHANPSLTLSAREDPALTLSAREEPSLTLSAREEPALTLSARKDFEQWETLARTFTGALSAHQEQTLMEKIELPREALSTFPETGWDKNQGCWTFPEKDGHGRTIGIQCRFSDGSKKCITGSQRGLALPSGWRDRPGPIFLVEGVSDTMALSVVGLSAIGRPSNTGGAHELITLLRQDDLNDRPIIVLGENDEKPDGRWPGKEGAEALCKQLRMGLRNRSIMVAVPPSQYKDVRDWVVDRIKAWPKGGHVQYDLIGKSIAEQFGRVASTMVESLKPTSGNPFPRPKYLGEMAQQEVGQQWVWDGFLARDRVTLFAAWPKVGKTTLLSHLLKAMETGGTFCGRAIMPSKAIVVSEEAESEWMLRKQALGLEPDHHRFLCRPLFGKPSMADWMSFILYLIECGSTDQADLIILDTLVDLWPAKDENSATEVQAALQPLRRLADGRAVLLVHHLRKSDGQEGTGSRGSGAMAGFVDVIMELRRAGKAADPHGRRRVLSTRGRMPGIPEEWIVEMNEEGTGFHHVGTSDSLAVQGREEKEELRRCDLREALLEIMPLNPPGWTRSELWNALPAEVRKNEIRFKSVLEAETGNLWAKAGSMGYGGGFRYYQSLKPREGTGTKAVNRV